MAKTPETFSLPFTPGERKTFEFVAVGRQKMQVTCGDYGTITFYIRRGDDCHIDGAKIPAVITFQPDDDS